MPFTSFQPPSQMMNVTVLMDIQHVQDIVVGNDNRMRTPLLKANRDRGERFPSSAAVDSDSTELARWVIEEHNLTFRNKTAAQSSGRVDGDLSITLEAHFPPLVLFGVVFVTSQDIIDINAEDTPLKQRLVTLC